MVEPVIKARLELVTTGGVSGAGDLSKRVGELGETATRRRGALGSLLGAGGGKGGIGTIAAIVAAGSFIANKITDEKTGFGDQPFTNIFKDKVPGAEENLAIIDAAEEEAREREANTETIIASTGATEEQINAMNLSDEELGNFADFVEDGGDKARTFAEVVSSAFNAIPQPIRDAMQAISDFASSASSAASRLNSVTVPAARLRNNDPTATQNLAIVDNAFDLVNEDIINRDIVRFSNISSKGLQQR